MCNPYSVFRTPEVLPRPAKSSSPCMARPAGLCAWDGTADAVLKLTLPQVPNMHTGAVL